MSELFDTLEEEMKEANLNADGELIDDKELEEVKDEKEEKAEEEIKEVNESTDDKIVEKEEVEEEKSLTPKEAAYHRRKARETEVENKRLKAELEEARRPKAATEPAATAISAPTATAVENPEPDKEKDLAGWLVWNAEEQRKWRTEQTKEAEKNATQRKMETLVQTAQQEIESIQDAYKKTNPDYDNAIKHARESYTKALKLLAPKMNEKQIETEINKEIFQMALQCSRDGTNLGEVLYDAAIERFGYEPSSQEISVTKSSPNKPNLRMVSNNKRRSASALEGGGQGAAGRITLEQAANMSPGELNALSPEDWSYLESVGF